MPDPAAHHLHTAEQMLDLVPEIPSAVRDRILPYLSDRDRAIEAAIDGTLRKEVSASAPGDGSAIVVNFPAFTIAANLVSVTVEKHYDVSRFQVSLATSGEMTTGVGTVGLGIHIVGDDNPAFTPVDVLIGAGVMNGYGQPTTFGNTLATVLPKGRYVVSAALNVSVGDSFTQSGWTSLRVVESLY